MSEEIRTKGRPDFGNHKFGVTRAKKHPKYVYATRQGMLLHEVAYAELRWYRIGGRGDYLVRRKSPSITYTTKCGSLMFGNDPEDESKRRTRKSTVCELPKPGAVLCGRCRGEGTVFAKGCQPKQGGPTRQEAKARLGCVAEANAAP